MSINRKHQDIIARYSALKVGGWVALVAPVCVWILADGASRGWSLPEGRYSALFPEAVIGAVLGLIICAAIIVNLGLARGVAIARIGDVFVLYFPFGRKRVALQSNVTVTSTEREIDVPAYGVASWFNTPPVIAHQITIHRPGHADLTFRTGLLRDSPAVIVQRMSALIGRP
jgi:hypothetical protein